MRSKYKHPVVFCYVLLRYVSLFSFMLGCVMLCSVLFSLNKLCFVCCGHLCYVVWCYLPLCYVTLCSNVIFTGKAK